MASPPPGKEPKPGLNIYGAPAVNPYKLTILCEELGIPYNYIPIDNVNAEQKSEWYTAINPNGRLPAIVHVKDDGTSQAVWESAACMLYVARMFDREGRFSWEVGSEGYWEMVAWLSWQVSGQGPMMGQAAHFVRYAPEHVPYGINRYTAESERLFSVLDKRLSQSPYVSGSKLTIADFAIFVWAVTSAWCNVDIKRYPHVDKWCTAIHERPAVQRGLKVPTTYPFSNDRVADPKRKAWYDSAQRLGKKMVKRDYENLVREDGKL